MNPIATNAKTPIFERVLEAFVGVAEVVMMLAAVAFIALSLNCAMNDHRSARIDVDAGAVDVSGWSMVPRPELGQ